MKASITYGLVTGLMATSFVVGIFLNNPLNLLSGLEIFSWIFIVAGMMLGTWRERSMRSEPFINFKEALKTAFQIFVIAYIIKFLAIYIIFNYVQPSLLERAREIAVKIFVEYRNQETPQEIFDQQLEAYRKGYFGPQFFDLGVMVQIIIGFLIALLTAVLFIREKPDY